MKWFDTKEIRDKESLSPEQIEYIKKPSFNCFGPLYILIRGHWDFVLATFGIVILEDTILKEITFSLLDLIALVALLYFFYFMIIHNRRLTWNRVKWSSFEAFKHSEEWWKPLGIIFFALSVLGFFRSVIKGF